MAKINLSDEEISKVIECLESQSEIPEDLLMKLSPGFFEKLRVAGKFDYKSLDRMKIPTLEYAGKRSEAVILAQAAITGGAVPLQIVRSFANGKNGDWKNLIIQGDNLQFLKTCYMNQDPLIKDKVKGKVKLIYIDPPFATKSDFHTNEGVFSYADKVDRAEFIEMLRERILFARENLSKNGIIAIHLDTKMVHYIKIIMDEIFQKSNFLNEIIWKRKTSSASRSSISNSHDSILFYKMSDDFTFNQVFLEYSENYINKQFIEDEKTGRLYRRHDVIAPPGLGGNSPRYEYKGFIPETRWLMKKDKLEILDKEGKIEWSSTGRPYRKLFLDELEGQSLSDIWTDINVVAGSEKIGYPTQKSEILLDRIINIFTNEDDLIFDFFAGSGTTAAVAEKLGRRWIVCDFGKHSIYTMQKRILNIAESKELRSEKKKKYGKPPKPFCVVSAGAYDFSKIMNLRKNKEAYISFVLGLFNIERENKDYTKKYKIDNIYAEKDSNPVEVYPVWDDDYLKNIRIDENYLTDIIKASGGKIKNDYYIITPETCTVINDITLKNESNENVNFKFLKFPYKVLEDISRQFQIEEQPDSSSDINKLISSTAFYFNQEVEFDAERTEGGFKINEFRTDILNRSKKKFEGLDGLSLILIDKNYDGKIFEMDLAIYAKDIKEGFVKLDDITDNTYIIAIDKHGNESKPKKI